MRPIILFAMLALLAVCWEARAQQVKEEVPKTKLEAFAGTVGAVFIKGYVKIGTLNGTHPVGVTAMTIRDAKTGKETSGAIFEIAENKSYGVDRSQSYVDSEELGDLLSGLTYISQADATITPMPFYEAQYSTRDRLRLVVFNGSDNQRHFSVHIGGKVSYFRIHDLPNFWDLIAEAKKVIENPSKLSKINPKTDPATVVTPTKGKP